MKLPSWIETDGRVWCENGAPVIAIRIRTDRRSFWAEMLRMAWQEYSAFWWHPVFWRTAARLGWRWVRGS